MTQILLTSEQVRQLATAKEPVVFVDANGHRVAYVSTGFTPAEIAEAERRADTPGPRYTTVEVLTYLQSLVDGT